MTLFTLLGSMICINWTIPTLSNEMVDHHSPPMNKGNAGLSFALCALTAGVGSPFIGKLCKYIHRKYIAAAGLLLLSIGLFLTGPSEYLHIPNRLWIIFVGLGVCGFANAMVLVTAIPELIYQAKTDLNEKRSRENKDPVNENVMSIVSDKGSALGNLVIVLGNIIAPLIGGSLVESV